MITLKTMENVASMMILYRQHQDTVYHYNVHSYNTWNYNVTNYKVDNYTVYNVYNYNLYYNNERANKPFKNPLSLSLCFFYTHPSL